MTENKESETTVSPDVVEKTRKRNLLIVKVVAIAIAVLLPFIVYFIKENQINRQRQAYEEQIAGLKNYASQKLTSVEQQHLAVIAKVFSWLAINELSRNNHSQIELNMQGLVKESGYRRISLISTTGVVVLSTDKKYEGQSYTGPLAGEIRNINETRSALQSDSTLLLLSPLHAMGVRMGAMIISYQPEKIDFPATLTE
jgi:hypothetical protein